MENLDDDFTGNDLSELCGRFEEMVKHGEVGYYEVDDLENLLEHYIVLHQVELAFKVIELAKAQYPYNKTFAIKEAELLSLTDKHKEALELLANIEELEGFNPDFHLVRANILSQCGKYNRAVDALNRALECAPDEHDIIYMNLAIEYQNMEDYTRAIEFLKKALDINIQNEDALYELAYCYELSKNYDEAIDMFSGVIDEAPYNAHAWFNLGASYQAVGEFEKALDAFDYAIVIDDSFHAAHFNKANALVRLGRYTEAIELYKIALSFEMLDSLIYFYIGDCYDNMDDHRNALTYFEKAIKKDGAMAEAWIGASSSLDMLGRELEALEYAKKSIELDADNGDYWCFLAGLQQKYDLPDDAAQSFETAISHGYLLEDLWEDYAQLALTTHNHELAESVIERGLDVHAANNLLQVYRAILLYRLNDEDQAFETLVQALVQDPKMIEDFLYFYPKGMEREEIQFLIGAMKS